MKISHEPRKSSREFIICSSQWPFQGFSSATSDLGYHKVTWVIPWPSVLPQEETNLEGSQVWNGWTGVRSYPVAGSVFGMLSRWKLGEFWFHGESSYLGRWWNITRMNVFLICFCFKNGYPVLGTITYPVILDQNFWVDDFLKLFRFWWDIFPRSLEENNSLVPIHWTIRYVGGNRN